MIEIIGAKLAEQRPNFTKHIGIVLLVGSSFGIITIPVEMIIVSIDKTQSKVEMVVEEIERQPVDWNAQVLGNTVLDISGALTATASNGSIS